MSFDPAAAQPPAAAPSAIAARFHDGQVALAQPVILLIDAGRIEVRGAALMRPYPWEGTRVSERLQHAPRLIRFADGCFCEVADQAALDAALAAIGYRPSWVARAQRHWGQVLVALVILLAAIWAVYRWALPVAADWAARRVPMRVEQALGARAAEIMEAQMLKPSTLPPARSGELQRLFASLVPLGERGYRLALHDGAGIGANAFALPGGTVVVTDQLVKLAPDDDALAAVMAHEIGHVENRHLLRRIIAGTVVGAVVTVIAGDASGLMAALPAALANLSYSRDMEREADRYAVGELKRRHIPIEPFARMLQRLQGAHGGADAPAWARYLQTHPDTEDRVAQIRAAE